ncbi:Fatty acyl-coa reductase [Thalictrum thalictroides]|uniref:Fatty acyl-CoA reductase n=1 Tax=Thalictrum thalictroides TaxID=46969 RepID=A0A7J6VL81_THATH|nr:Fatty acyl-coa reductase [Thalictrum thalictroides]
MNSLFVQGIYTSSTLVIGDDLWEKKKRKMIRLCYNENSRNLTISSELTSHMNESTAFASTKLEKVPFPSLSIKELAPYKQRKEESRSREVVNPDGFGIGIVPFLKGKVFLITGATGFLAKVLIEKILRTVPDVHKIYLLIKAKDKNEAMQRLKKEIVDTELFMHMRQFYGKSYKDFMLKKLVPIVGNVCESGLGMEVGFADHIANEVDIIVHSAGSTTFDERYDVAIDINTLGPCRILSFAKRCKGLKLFMHVSTAYTNGQRRGIISEKPFHNGDSITRERAGEESPMSSFPVLEVEAQIKMALVAKDAFDDNTVTQKMKDFGMERARKYGWQDTYVFTKAMGEMMIESQRNEIPVVIIRPSIIESTYKEPIPGWIEGLRMMDPVIISYGKGELTGFPMNPKGVIDVVPADMVVNAMITAMAKHGAVKKPGLSVYHIASSVANPTTCQDLFDYFFEYFDSFPYMDLQRKPINIQRAKFFNNMDDFHTHIHTQAVQSSSHSPQGVNISKRLQRSLDYAKQLANLYEPYTFYEGRFDNTNVQMLMQQLSQEEKESFDFNVGSLDWKDYICNIHIPGLLRHVQKGRGL